MVLFSSTSLAHFLESPGPASTGPRQSEDSETAKALRLEIILTKEYNVSSVKPRAKAVSGGNFSNHHPSIGQFPCTEPGGLLRNHAPSYREAEASPG